MMTTPTNSTPEMFAVWIAGLGWLRVPPDDHNRNSDVFVSEQWQVAQEVASLYGAEIASVRYFDESMKQLEPVFIERERQMQREQDAQPKGLLGWLR